MNLPSKYLFCVHEKWDREVTSIASDVFRKKIDITGVKAWSCGFSFVLMPLDYMNWISSSENSISSGFPADLPSFKKCKTHYTSWCGTYMNWQKRTGLIVDSSPSNFPPPPKLMKQQWGDMDTPQTYEATVGWHDDGHYVDQGFQISLDHSNLPPPKIISWGWKNSSADVEPMWNSADMDNMWARGFQWDWWWILAKWCWRGTYVKQSRHGQYVNKGFQMGLMVNISHSQVFQSY